MVEKKRKRPAELDLAAKKKHVRELAKHSRWKEISRLYGDKMVAKAKEYVEKNRSKHTPQSLAKEILARNGYNSSPPRKSDAMKPFPTAQPAAQPIVERQPLAVIQNDSPETVTEEQKRLIELRRREALERRNRQRQAVPPSKISAISYTLQTNQAKLQQQGQITQLIQKEIEAAAQLVMWEEENPAEAHVITPERKYSNAECRNQHRAIQPNARFGNKIPIQPQHSAHLIHELDAAADIILWELEQENCGSYSMMSARKPEGVPVFDLTQCETKKQGQTPSIVDELAAAADIARWEHEHEDEVEIVSKPPKVRQGRINESNFRSRSAGQSCPQSPEETKTVVSSIPYETPRSSTRRALPQRYPSTKGPYTVNQAQKSSETRSFEAKCVASATEEISHAPKECEMSTFVQKHFLDEKFEESVLDFVEMMLS